MRICTKYCLIIQQKKRIYPSPYPIFLLFLLYFCGIIRQYFVQILIVSAHGGATSLNRISHKTIFCTDTHTVLNRISLGIIFVSVRLYYCNVFLFMKIINRFRVGITPPQYIFFFPHFFVWFIYVIIIIIIMSSCKRGFCGGSPTLNMFMIFINRKTPNYKKRRETKTKLPGDSPF